MISVGGKVMLKMISHNQWQIDCDEKSFWKILKKKSFQSIIEIRDGNDVMYLNRYLLCG